MAFGLNNMFKFAHPELNASLYKVKMIDGFLKIEILKRMLSKNIKSEYDKTGRCKELRELYKN